MTDQQEIKEPEQEEKPEEKVIEFQAEIIKVQTMSDGGIRIILDISADKIEIAAELMKARQLGAVLEIAAVAILPNEWD